MVRATIPALIGALALLVAAAGGMPPEEDIGAPERIASEKTIEAVPGLEYRLQVHKEPRPNRVHILRVDLAGSGLRPVVVLADDPDGTGPAEAALTPPLELAGDDSVLAFINTNPWSSLPDATGKTNSRWYEGQPVDISGLAAAQGEVRSRARSGGASVWVSERGRVVLGNVTRGTPVAEGMAGFQPIVREGKVVVSPGGPIHPRTAIGTNETGDVLWLVVVDGRQLNYSLGMTLHELGCVMRDLGCHRATNMDGGGSSIMGMVDDEGEMQVVNSPSDRRLGVIPVMRPLPMILTIRKKPESRLQP